jgi:hypothetical protein
MDRHSSLLILASGSHGGALVFAIGVGVVLLIAIADPTYSPPSAAGKNDGMKVLADYVPPRSRRRRPVMRPPTR